MLIKLNDKPKYVDWYLMSSFIQFFICFIVKHLRAKQVYMIKVR